LEVKKRTMVGAGDLYNLMEWCIESERIELTVVTR
jgi:hypothetical protein